MVKIKYNQKGVALLVMVIYLAVIAVMIVSVIESRLLLSVERFRSLSDTILSSYKAESSIYDYVNKILNYSSVTFPFGPTTITLADGTKIVVMGTHDAATNTDTIDITASRTYAVNKLQLVRKITTTMTATEAQVVLLLDCSGSMNDPSGVPGKPRMQVLKESLVGTAAVEGKDGILTTLSMRPDKDKYKVGVIVYALGAYWLTDNNTLTGNKIMPGVYTVDQVINFVKNGFNTRQDNSPACTGMLPQFRATNIGGGVALANQFFAPPNPLVKKVQVIITDGEPSARGPHSSCKALTNLGNPLNPLSALCTPECLYKPAGSNPYGINAYSCVLADCYKDGEAFMACSMATAGQVWNNSADYSHWTFPVRPLYNGTKPADIDLYGVTVFQAVTFGVEEIFTKYTVTNGYQNVTSGGNLADVLNQFLIQIITSTNSLQIRKVVP